MYVNTLISLQENIPTYGVEGKTVTGHVTISTPGIIKCYVQDLKKTNNRTFELYVISSKQNTGVKIGELGTEKETKWRVDEKNVMGGSIALKDIDGVAIIVKENELRGVDAILLGFKNERFTVLPILEAIVPRAKVTQEEVEKVEKVEKVESAIISKGAAQEPEPIIIPKGPEQEPGPVIIPQGPQQGPGPVIIPKGPEQGPGPVIIPQGPQQGPGPVIIPKGPEQGPGPVIIPKGPEQGSGPVIIPQEPEQEPEPVIIPGEEEPGPVIPNQGKKPCEYEERKDSIAQEMAISKQAIDEITKKLKHVKEQNVAEELHIEKGATGSEEVQQEVWELESNRTNEKQEDSLKVEETPEEIDYLAEIEKKLQDIQNRLKNVRGNDDDDDFPDEENDSDDSENEEQEGVLESDEEPEEAGEFEDTEDNETLKPDNSNTERLEILRTESVIGDILQKVKSLKHHQGSQQRSDGESIGAQEQTVEHSDVGEAVDKEREDINKQKEEISNEDKMLGASANILDEIYARGEMVEAFIQEPEDTEWVKIAYSDFLKIPTLTYEWCTQPFITFAFYKYNEILLGHNGEKNYSLGIPDVYHPDRKAILSDPIPVERFLCRRNIEPVIGEYGYWVIALQSE